MNKLHHIIRMGMLGVMICVPFTGLHAQNLIADFKRINAVFFREEGIAYRFQIKYITNGVIGAGEMLEGMVKIKGDLYYQKIGTNEIIRNQETLILLNREEKFILLYPPQQVASLGSETVRLDTSLVHCDSSVFQLLKSGMAMYTLFYDDGSIPKLEVTFHADSYWMSELVLYQDVAGTEQLVIHFELPEPASDWTDPLWQLSTYVTTSGGAIRPSKAFSSYEVIDFRSQP